MQGKDWRSLQVYLFCNPLTAARMVEYSPAFAAYLPCRISLVEDGDGQLWLITMNMDLMLYGGRPLPDELREEAEGVRAAMLAVPSRCGATLPHLTAHDIAELDREIRNALEGLADGN